MTILGQFHFARCAVQQAYTDFSFELLQGSRDAGFGQAEVVSGLCEAVKLGHAGEDLQTINQVHCSIMANS
jgi:hypothetical protein